VAGPGVVMRGRDAELSEVEDALRAVAAGIGGVVLVEGEAGIGKSRFIREVVQQAAAHDLHTVFGVAEELEQGRPFGALTRAFGIAGRAEEPQLAAIAQELDLPPSPDDIAAGASRLFRVQEAIIDLVGDRTARRPLVLTVDDLQWVDTPSAAALAALSRRTADLALLLVLAYRPFPPPPDRLLDVATAGRTTRIALGALDADAVAELVGEAAGVPAGTSLLALVEGARGNPFFVIELVHALCDDRALDTSSGAAEVHITGVPPTLRQTILRRVRSLSPPALDLLRGGAVLGGSFELDSLAGMLERSTVSLHPDTLDAVAAGLLEEDGPRLRIRHDLIREAISADTPEAIRVSLHRKAAAVLSERGEPAVVVASHLVHGHDRSPAAAAALRRAAGELAGDDPVRAVELLDRVLAVEQLDPTERQEVVAELVPLLIAVGRLSDAVDSASRALATGPAPACEARLRLGLAEALLETGDADGAVEQLERAGRSEALDDQRRAVLVADIAWARLASFDLDAADRDARMAEEWARQHAAAGVLSSALAVQSRIAAYSADFERAVRLGEAAVAAAEGADTWLRRTPEYYSGLALLNADRAEEAIRVLAAGRKQAEAAGAPWAVANYHNALVMCALHGGSWDDAITEAEAGRVLYAEAGTRAAYIQTESMLGLMWLHRADYDQARHALDRAEADFAIPGFDVRGIIWLLWLRAAFAELEGDVSRSARLLGSAFDLAVQRRVHSVKFWFGPEVVRLALAAGQREQAERAAAEVRVAAEGASTASARGAAAWCGGLIAEDAVQLEEAVVAYRSTSRQLDHAGAAEATAAALVVRQGSDAHVVELLDEALAICEDLGAAHDARRITATLRDLGVRRGARGPRQRPRTGLASLTPTERTVLELVGSDLRNAEIAERLFVSRRTVETHVGRLYAKLQVRSRVALARQAPGLSRS
jgi:DNA-binding CsgD family transcriptional regulator